MTVDNHSNPQNWISPFSDTHLRYRITVQKPLSIFGVTSFAPMSQHQTTRICRCWIGGMDVRSSAEPGAQLSVPSGLPRV